jgi:pimeloyl-ACP methyl ester carboxylesterase
VRRRLLLAGGVLLALAVLAVGGCSLLGPDFSPAVGTATMSRDSLESRFVALGETTVHYVASGDGDVPILFVHGSPGTWESWRGFLLESDLRRKGRLLAIDRIGFGGSSRGRAEGSLERQAQALAAVIEFEGGQPAIVVGHSLGGPIAARLAADRPELVAGLLFIAPSLDPGLERRRWFNVAGSLRVVQWFLPLDWVTSNREIWPLRTELEELRPSLAGIRVPSIVIQGGLDSLVPPGNADFAEREFAESVLEVRRMPEATHFVLWQDPLSVRSAIADLISRAGAERRDAIAGGNRPPGGG